MKLSVPFALAALLAAVAFQTTGAAEPAVTLETVTDPGPNKLDEPLAKEFSLDRAVHFLDSAALFWQKQKGCFSCHTNYAYLYTRPALSADAPAHRTVRQFAEELVLDRWAKKGPRWDAEVVATAAALAFNDAATTGKLHPVTKTALDRMWTKQRADGGWGWLKCEWPPMENDDHYGVTLAALAVGVAPGNYVQTEAAKKGMAGVRRYLKANPGTTVHHRAMTLWAATYVPDLLTKAERQAAVDALLKLQKPDGGWAVASLGDWKRGDGKEQDTQTSDGYATGFSVYVLRRVGLGSDDARIRKGVAWLKSHQRESGRWVTRSLFKDNRHYLSHAATAFALLALAECGEIPRAAAVRAE